MSSPYEGEFGDWMGYPPSPNDKHKIPGSDKTIISRHKKTRIHQQSLDEKSTQLAEYLYDFSMENQLLIAL